MIENEDLRDQIALLNRSDDVNIDYLPYLMPRLLEKTVGKAEDIEEL